MVARDAVRRGGPGWAITGVILGGGIAYVALGLLYGRSQNPPKPGDGALCVTLQQSRSRSCTIVPNVVSTVQHKHLWTGGVCRAHPDGEGAIAWHPHYDLWGEGKLLVLDGFKYTKMRWHIYQNGGSVKDYKSLDNDQLNEQYRQP